MGPSFESSTFVPSPPFSPHVSQPSSVRPSPHRGPSSTFNGFTWGSSPTFCDQSRIPFSSYFTSGSSNSCTSFHQRDHLRGDSHGGGSYSSARRCTSGPTCQRSVPIYAPPYFPRNIHRLVLPNDPGQSPWLNMSTDLALLLLTGPRQVSHHQIPLHMPLPALLHPTSTWNPTIPNRTGNVLHHQLPPPRGTSHPTISLLPSPHIRHPILWTQPLQIIETVPGHQPMTEH